MSTICMGIDVSKQRLDCHTTGNLSNHFENNEVGIQALIVWMQKGQSIDRIVLEATGSYHALCANLLAKAGLPVVVTNPRQVRDFAKATGIDPNFLPSDPNFLFCLFRAT